MGEVLSSKIVKTRKPHHCLGCGREFPAGIEMKREGVLDDKPFTAYLCKSCQEVCLQMNHYDREDGFCYDDLREDAEEYEKSITTKEDESHE